MKHAKVTEIMGYNERNLIKELDELKIRLATLEESTRRLATEVKDMQESPGRHRRNTVVNKVLEAVNTGGFWNATAFLAYLEDKGEPPVNKATVAGAFFNLTKQGLITKLGENTYTKLKPSTIQD